MMLPPIKRPLIAKLSAVLAPHSERPERTKNDQSSSVAINMFAKAVLREHRLPFDVVSYNLDPFYSQANQERLLKAKERMEKTGGTAHELVEDDLD